MMNHNFSSVNIEVLYKDSLSIRAIDIYKDSLVGFGYDKGYGFLDLSNQNVELHQFELDQDTIEKKNWVAQQRAVVFKDDYFFSLGIGAPARLRKVNIDSKAEEIVYVENHEKSFYDAIAFWNTKEGIAMGDPTDACLSIIITRDGGKSWQKVSCDNLPQTVDGEAAFAASNGNIAIKGDHTWIVSGGMQSRVFYSSDKGITWSVVDTPMLQGSNTTGAYAVAFYDEHHGAVIGGDYTKPELNKGNKIMTNDGGKSWQLIAEGEEPGYKSCVRYVPNGGAKELVAVGFTGITISNDSGITWKELSKEGFYTLRFINDSIAITAGKGRIAKLTFK